MTDPGALFDAEYFENHCGPVPYDREEPFWQEHFGICARYIQGTFQPERVLDVGCAKGFLVERLRDLGVEASGIDVSEYAIEQVDPSVREHCALRDALEPLGQHYDLITCLDVAQHVSEEDADRLVRNLCRHADEIIFAVGEKDHSDPTAINVQPIRYWTDRFAQNGFHPVVRGGPEAFGPHAVHFRKFTRKLRVAIFSREKEEWAVARIRLLDPLRELERMGRMDVTFVSMFHGPVPVEALLDADLWVLHREFVDRELSEGLLEAAELLNKPVVFELDDLISNVPRSNPFWSDCTRVMPDVKKAIARADFVTVTNQRLVEELEAEVPGVAQKAYVRSNVVNPEIWGSGFRPARHRPGEPLVVGWCGSTTHDDDLGVVKEAIEYLLRKHRGALEFHFFGYVPDQLAETKGVFLVQGTTGDLAQYARGVRGSNLHLAIAPLMDHPFNHCKSDLKYLEYSLCCVPGIYSDITPYAGSVRNGITGLLVANETGAWVEAIERLMENQGLRDELAKSAYEEVRATKCVDVRATEWDDLYRSFVVTGPQNICAPVDDEAIRKASSLMFLFQARQQARAGEMAGSVVSLEASLSLDRSRSGDVVAAGRMLMGRQEFGVAEQVFHAAVREAPEDAEGHLWLTKFYRALGDVLSADRALVAAAEAHPADPDLVSEHVEHLIDMERIGEIGPRLNALVEAEHHPEEAVMVAEMMVRMGRAKEACAVIEKAGRAFPEVDFSQLQTALAHAKRAGLVNALDSSSTENGMKIAVYTRDPLTSPRVMQRLRSPLRALEQAALAAVRWSDGVLDKDVVDWADVVVLHRDFSSRDLGGPIVERARKRGLPVVFELDDLPYEWMALNGDQQADSHRDDVSWLVGAADVTTVSSQSLCAVLSELNPSACERIVVMETAIDPGVWESSRPWRNRVGKPFQVGLVTDWCRPAEIRRLVSALSPLLGNRAGELVLSTWSPRTQPGALAPCSQNVGSATPFYVEYARKMQRRGLDIALVPVSNDLYYTTLSDSIAVELAAAKIPAIFSAREPFASSVVQGRTGILLGDEPDAWVAMVQRLTQCDRTRRDLANRAWNIAFAERTVQPQAAIWSDLFGSLVEGRRAGQLLGASI